MSLEFSAQLPERNFHIELALQPGKTLAVMGPNGAGKSTLASLLAGLLRPAEGRAALAGTRLFDTSRGIWLPPHQRGISLLAQQPLLFPHLNARENVAFGPRSQGMPKTEARTRADEWLEAVDALDLAARRPAHLSGGQAQRVAIARALAADPELLLLDEPMAAMDIHAVPAMRRLLKNVLAERSTAIITHDVLDALMLADQLAIIEDGRLSEIGETRQVLDRPRSHFAASLAGLNLLTGTATPDGIDTDYGHFAGTHQLIAGAAAAAVFAPEEVSLFKEQPHGSPRNSHRAQITDIEPHGSVIRVRAGRLAADITPAALADLELAVGDWAWFTVKASAVKLY